MIWNIGLSVRWIRSAVVLIGVLLTVATTSPAEAIIIRHDVDDAAYVQDDNAYPAVFEISERRGGVATLIGPQWALTVGHVGQDILQGHEVTIAGQSYSVERVILHPEWKTRMLEMALLKLDRPVQGVDPIPPYEKADELVQIVTFVGRGDTGTGLTGPIDRDHKLRAATNRVERVEGSMLVFRFDAPEDEHVTQLEGISGPGDSGGPALIETADGLRLAGLSVASSGRPKGRYGAWEFYTRVSPEAMWIWDITSPAGTVRPVATPGSGPSGEVEVIVTQRIVPSGDVEPVVTPGSAFAGAAGPIVIRRFVPSGDVEPAVSAKSGAASEVEAIVTPRSVPAAGVDSEAASGFGAAAYGAVAALGVLVLIPFAWWYRSRRPSKSG